MSETTRLNINLNQSTAKALKVICENNAMTYTEAVRRAIVVFHYLDAEQRSGRRIQIRNGNDVKEMVLL